VVLCRLKKKTRWVWLALCRRTRQIVAYVVGDRSAATCRRLWQQLPPLYRSWRSFSDFWDAYSIVFGARAPAHPCVGKQTGHPAHVERWINTLRQRLARFVRKTLSFSKTDAAPLSALKLFIHRYNITRALSVKP
jgi:IS1 family transposase